MKFIEQFKDFMILILLVAAIISAFLSNDIIASIIIVCVVIVNAIFGVIQEAKAEQAIEALQEMATPNANVRRDDHIITIKSDELVPGDIVLLEAGDVVPADLRLIEVAGLKIEESSLTGESVPVEKNSDTMIENTETISLWDRHNMAYANSNVTYGRGVGVVVETGMNTEVGKIAGMLTNTQEIETPLKRNLNQLGKVLTGAILVIAVLMFVIGLLNGRSWLDMLLTSISLAVAAIPEGLPAIVTVILALGTQKMAKKNAIVRKLPAVETLGSTNIICSDKTGTLTLNQMTVEQLYTYNKLQPAKEPISSNSMLLTIMIYNNDTKISQEGTLIGDPTETALIQFGIDHQILIEEKLIEAPRIAEIPFDSERKLMTTIHETKNKGYLVTVKGAPDELLKRCKQTEENDQFTILDQIKQVNILESNKKMAKQALRVLGMAYKYVETLPTELVSELVEQDLIFAGLVGMIDPERKEAAEAVATAKAAGIRPIMITGDHKDTAEAIAIRLGITPDNDENRSVITGSELEALSNEEYEKKVEQYSVYARVSPEHKVKIVRAWQKKEKVVAMTGDGVNDAPALKTADIGIGMGITGTEVSKGASDMILADDNFSTIISAIKEGRKIFANIQKTIQYLLSANLGEVLTLFIATMLNWDTLLPIHLLWINLVTDTFPAIALGVEPVEEGIMQHAPRGKKSSFFSNGVFSSVLYQGIIQSILTLFVYQIAILLPAHTAENMPSLSHHALYHLQHADALTMTFATLGLIQLFHAFNVKSIHQSLFSVGLFRKKTFNWAILISFLLLGTTIVIPGFNDLFSVTQLDLYQWGIVLSTSFAIIPIVEITKFFQRKLKK